MTQIISAIFFQMLATNLFAESTLPGTENYVVRGCVQNPGERFAPMPVESCGNKIYCVNSFVECSFIKSSALANGRNWQAVTQTPNMNWIRLGATIFCKMEDGACPTDLDSCANQSAKDAGCSLRKMPGAKDFETVPREGVN